MSEEMVKKAQSASSSIQYEVADIRTYKAKKKNDAVISLFHVMSYQNTNEDIKQAFKSARASYKNGGYSYLMYGTVLVY